MIFDDPITIHLEIPLPWGARFRYVFYFVIRDACRSKEACMEPEEGAGTEPWGSLNM